MKKKPSAALRPKRGRPASDPAMDPWTGPGSCVLSNSESVQSASQIRRLTMPQLGHSLLRFLNDDRNGQKLCDVSVTVGGRVYRAHRVVLAHGSSYFHAELSKSPAAAAAHVKLDHVEDSVFQHLLGFLYTAECTVAEKDLPALAEAARFLDMMDVLKLLSEGGEVDPVGVTHGTPDTRRPPEVEVASSLSAGEDTDVPSDVEFTLNRRSATEVSRQDSSAHNHTQSKTRGQCSATTRRSARTIRMPTKYNRDDLRHATVHPAEKIESSSPSLESRNGVEVAAEVVAENQTSQLDVNDPSKPADAMDEDGEDGGGGEVNAGGVAQDNLLGGCHGDGTESEQGRTAEDQAGGEPEAGGSSQSAAYPEGLAPVIIQTANKKTLQCPKCDKIFDRAGKYESHTRVHTGEKPFQCDICLQCYSTKSNLTVHKKKHASDAPFPKKEHKCSFCNKLHASKKTLAKHVRRFHPEHSQEFFTKRKRKSEGWKCAICSKTFSRRPHLQEHMILHTQDRPFKCSFCEEYFRSRFARLKHQEKYHLGPFPCEICGRQFNDTGNKKRHIECTHGGKRKWTCFVCGKSVRERTTLTEHLRIHSGEKPHLCSICGQSFRHSSSYRLHLRVHHDDKRYECDECGKTFIRHDHLTKHQKIHSGRRRLVRKRTSVKNAGSEKPHRCPECHQTFRIKKTLTKHMVIHSDARPFNCPHCSATFKRKDKLKYHVDHVHSARFTEQPLGEDKAVSLSFEEPSKTFHAEPKSALQSSPSSSTSACAPVAVGGGAQGDSDVRRAPSLPAPNHGVAHAQATEQPQGSGYQPPADLAFLEKYTLNPQPANIVHPVRPEQILDPREQSYLGTLLGLVSATSVQNLSSSDHSH
ncbi:unnamed protein product [Menidia menidia]|uniref:Zinc finger and BTB domain-containing protein 41 n=1 Tax=Menidia menidia TaxID=238744 RepID=A0A8S4APX9_9TELE|nr:unnamed protein product [Menidia menidia]